jgi:hypothetical protein
MFRLICGIFDGFLMCDITFLLFLRYYTDKIIYGMKHVNQRLICAGKR